MSVIPGQCESHREADNEQAQHKAIEHFWPMEGMSEKVSAVRKGERGAEVGKTPLQDLVLFYALPRIGGSGRRSVFVAAWLRRSGLLDWLGHSSLVSRMDIRRTKSWTNRMLPASELGCSGSCSIAGDKV